MDFTARMLKAHPPEKVPFGFGKREIKRDPYEVIYTLRTYYLPLVFDLDVETPYFEKYFKNFSLDYYFINSN